MIAVSSTPVHPSHSPHCSRTHTPSPGSSPSLRPVASTIASTKAPSPKIPPVTLPSSHQPNSGSTTTTTAYPNGLTPPTSPSLPSRSFARAPPVRPYQSPMNRGISLGNTQNGRGAPRIVPLQGDTKVFADLVVSTMQDRSRKARSGILVEHEHIEDVTSSPGVTGFEMKRKVRSMGGSLSGSYEGDKAEFIVDIPVWSPGCFQDLSTLHALRETTLSRIHSILSYLQTNHSLPASYRLLARSATAPSAPSSPRATHVSSQPSSPLTHPKNAHQRGSLGPHNSVGWGCIRLVPFGTTPRSTSRADSRQRKELKPHVRRSSMVINSKSHSRSPERSTRNGGGGTRIPGLNLTTEFAIPELKLDRLDLDSAIVDDIDDDDREGTPVELKEGYISGSSVNGSDDENEEESADHLVAKEVEKRGAKEGDAFLMTLFGQPALILM